VASREKSNRQMEATVNIKRYGTQSSICLRVRQISASPAVAALSDVPKVV